MSYTVHTVSKSFFLPYICCFSNLQERIVPVPRLEAFQRDAKQAMRPSILSKHGRWTSGVGRTLRPGRRRASAPAHGAGGSAYTSTQCPLARCSSEPWACAKSRGHLCVASPRKQCVRWLAASSVREYRPKSFFLRMMVFSFVVRRAIWLRMFFEMAYGVSG